MRYDRGKKYPQIKKRLCTFVKFSPRDLENQMKINGTMIESAYYSRSTFVDFPLANHFSGGLRNKMNIFETTVESTFYSRLCFYVPR